MVRSRGQDVLCPGIQNTGANLGAPSYTVISLDSNWTHRWLAECEHPFCRFCPDSFLCLKQANKYVLGL
jgi:hypothetical protein